MRLCMAEGVKWVWVAILLFLLQVLEVLHSDGALSLQKAAIRLRSVKQRHVRRGGKMFHLRF